MLRDDKVEQLAHKIADKLIKLDDIELIGDRQTLEHNIREAFFDDFAAQEDLEDEVDEMLKAALAGRSRDSVNYAELRRKAIKELARKKGFVL